MLKDSTVRTLIQNAEAVKVLLAKIEAEPPDKPVDPPDPPVVDPAPPTISITTPRPITEQSGSFNVVFATADANKDPVTVTVSISVEPADAAKYYSIPSGTLTGSVRVRQAAPTTEMPTIPGATVTLTLTANDGTADSSPATFVLKFATREKPPITDPKPPTGEELPPVGDFTSNIKGKSRLGGLSLNKVGGIDFIKGLLREAGLDPDTLEDEDIEEAIDFILQLPGVGDFLPNKQIKLILTAQDSSSVFQNEPINEDGLTVLHHENFGNAITPSLVISDFSDIFTGDFDVKKYLTSDNLNVYVRVPSTLDGGKVEFRINSLKVADAKRITSAEFQADTIPYTFRLEETLAATNLPAWPDSDNQFTPIFSGVALRYSKTGLDGDYISVPMEIGDVQREKGIVWEFDLGINPGENVYYFFEVTLDEPLTLKVINPEALAAAIDSPDGTHTKSATNTYRIESWAMPDPRNLQLRDRGIFKALFTDDVKVEIFKSYLSFKADGKVRGNQLQDLRNVLLNSAGDLFTKFENSFDPMLVSVFTVSDVDIATESLWYANIGSIVDGDKKLEAVVYDANGLADLIAVDFETDTSAPKATVNISLGENTIGFTREDGVYVTTAPTEGTPVLLNFSSTVTEGVVGAGEGYLIYQLIKLDDDGNPLGTWLPLTVENSMIASDLWGIAQELLASNATLKDFADDSLEDFLKLIYGILTPAGINAASELFPEVAAIARSLGLNKLSEEQFELLRKLIGATVADLNAIPLTFEPSRSMVMPFMEGNYGIRAMGIDTLFNVGSYEPPAIRLKIVPPEFDTAQVTVVSIGDLNDDGDPNGPYETGTIYSNTLDDVTLTVTVTERTEHPATAMVQYLERYEDGNAVWQNIGELDLAGTQAGSTLPIKWANLTAEVFDELIMADDTVKVRAVATNNLTRGLTPPDAPVEFEIKLDAGKLDARLHPPGVLAIMMDPMSITKTNPDSGAPQGTIVINGYTPVFTGPDTESVRFEAKRPEDEDWEDIGVATAGMEFTVEVDDVENPIGPPDTYYQWSITVDTTTLHEGNGDTITKDSPGARQDYIFNEITNRYEVVDGYVVVDDNKYEVRAVAISMDELEWSSDARTNFSVDNDDDVTPRGLTHVSVTNLKAFSDSDKVFIDRPVEVAEDGSYTVGGLVDRHDDAVDSPVVTFTIKPQAPLETYQSVRLVPLNFPENPENTVRAEVTPTEEVGVFEVAMFDIGTLTDDDELAENDEYVENGRYMFYALASDEFDNEQDKLFETDGTLITVNVANTRRPAPGVLAITIDDPTPNPDSGAPSGVITFNGYTPNPTSAPTVKIRFEIKRQDDEEWTLVRIDAGMDKRQDALEVELEPILPGIDIAKTKDMEHPYPVAWPETYYKWAVDFDTTFLTDTITADSPAARDHTKDENAYMVRAIAIDGVERVVEGVIADLSIDNTDDVVPLGPTKVEVTSVDAVDSVLEVAEDGSYTVGGLVDKHDDAVNSPVITLTITPTAERRTYDSVRLISTLEDTVIGELTETAEGSGVFEITVDVGTLTDNETYVANGTLYVPCPGF